MPSLGNPCPAHSTSAFAGLTCQFPRKSPRHCPRQLRPRLHFALRGLRWPSISQKARGAGVPPNVPITSSIQSQSDSSFVLSSARSRALGVTAFFGVARPLVLRALLLGASVGMYVE